MHRFDFTDDQFFKISWGLYFVSRSSTYTGCRLYFTDTKHEKYKMKHTKLLHSCFIISISLLNDIFECYTASFNYLEKKKHEKSQISWLSTICYQFLFCKSFSWFFMQIKFLGWWFQRYFMWIRFHGWKIAWYFAHIIFLGKSQNLQNPQNQFKN